MGSVIAPHNWRIIQQTSDKNGCNCRNRAECPLDNKCLIANIVYKAVVSAPSKPDKKYFGIAETSFKYSFRNRTRYFRHKKYVNSTKLSKDMWKLKEEKITANVKLNICQSLSIMSIVHGTPKGGVCKLCLTEKFWLLKHFNDKNLLNKKSEFITKCRNENKLLVKSVEKGYCYSYIYCCIILVFVTKYFVFRL